MKTRSYRRKKRSSPSLAEIVAEGAPRTQVDELPNGLRWSARAYSRAFSWALIGAAIAFAAGGVWLYVHTSKHENYIPISIVLGILSLVALYAGIQTFRDRAELRLEGDTVKLSGPRVVGRWHKEFPLVEMTKLGMGDRRYSSGLNLSTNDLGWFGFTTGRMTRTDNCLRFYAGKEIIELGRSLSPEQLRFAGAYLGPALKKRRESRLA